MVAVRLIIVTLAPEVIIIFDRATNVSVLCCRCLLALSPIALTELKTVALGNGDIYCKDCATQHHDSFSNILEDDLGLEIEEGIDEITNPKQNVVLNYSLTKRSATYFNEFRRAFRMFFVDQPAPI